MLLVFRFYQLRKAGAAVLLGLGCAWAGPAVAAGGMLRIAAFGDSLMAGYGLPEEHGFVSQLQAHLRRSGYEIEVLNLSVSGNTTADGLNRVGQVVRASPDGVLLGLGSNDALRNIDPAAVSGNLDAIISRLQQQSIPVLLIGAQSPLNWGLRYKSKFDDVFEDLADEHGLELYPFILEGVALVPSLNQADGVHPNAAGVQIMVQKMAPAVQGFVDGIGN